MNNYTAHEIAQYIQAREAGKVIGILTALVIGTFLALDAYTLFVEKRKQVWTKPVLRDCLVSLFLVCVFSISSTGLCTAAFFHDWTSNPPGCTQIIKAAPVLYMIGKQCTYYFLYVRMKIVHNALNLNQMWIYIGRWITFLCIFIGIPIVAYPLFLISVEGHVNAIGGTCDHFVSHTYVIILTAAIDFVFSMVLLGLFLVPLLRHLHTTKASTNIMSVAKFNLVASIALSLVTIGQLMFMLGSHLDLVNKNYHFTHIQVVHLALAVADMMLSVIIIHTFTNLWVPSTLKQFTWCCKGGKTSSSSEREQSPMTSSTAREKGGPVSSRENGASSKLINQSVVVVSTGQ